MKGQQGNAPFPSLSNSQDFSLFSNAWNPYQGVSSPFTTLVGGNGPIYSNSMFGGGVLLQMLGHKDFPMEHHSL